MPMITEKMILSVATNAAAVANAKKLSQKGSFVQRRRSSDGTLYWGSCKGSGEQPYRVSVDFTKPDEPAFSCSCPSRQHPCKHGLALLYELRAGKMFLPEAPPQDVLEKREKRQAAAEKAAAKAAAGAAPPKKSGAGNAARAKKLRTQLEGLQMTETLVRDLITAGLGSMGGTKLADYRQVARQLGDYYLPGPQLLLNRLIAEIEAFQKDGSDAHYAAAVELLRRLWSLVRKGQSYLNNKLETGSAGLDADPLYAELGGVWKLAELQAVGCSRQNARLVQLAFWVGFDETAQTWSDTGVWADLAGGPLCLTQNYRPVKALKHLRADDSVFGLLRVPEMAVYPGEGNPRARWETAEAGELTVADWAALHAQAAPGLAPVVKQAKNLLKNTLAAPVWFALVRYARIARCADGYVLEDAAGETILLGDAPGMEPTAASVGLLQDPALFRDQVLLAGFYYDPAARRLLAQPISILTADRTVRLLY